MTEKRLSLREADLFGLLSFLVSSAYLLAQGEDSEELYPSFRMMDAACRLAAMCLPELEDRSWAQLLSSGCEQGLELAWSDSDVFVEYLSNSTRMLAKEMTKR